MDEKLKDLLTKTENSVIEKKLIIQPHIENQDPRKVLEEIKSHEPQRSRGRPKGSKNLGGHKVKRKEHILAAQELWRKGILFWKLDSNQKSTYDFIEDTKSSQVILTFSRQTGKSYLMCTYAIEKCMNNKGFRVAYVLPKQNQARSVIRNNFLQILDDCPESIRPVFKTQDNKWLFEHNGSEVVCVGTDNQNIENVRGQKFDLVIMDECGFMDDFSYCYESVLVPTMTTSKRPLTIMISTPPKSAGHEFNKFIDLAEFQGTLIRKTIFDCPRFSRQQIQTLIDSVGGLKSVTFRREYLCEKIPDINSLVIPEANEENMSEIIRPHIKPIFYSPYTSGDFGNKDWTAYLFAYFDFKENLVVIEDELVFNKVNHTTQEMADGIKAKENTLWIDDAGDKIPIDLRVCDNNLQIIADFQRLHGLNFLGTRKDDKDAQINELRMMISNKRIRINPRCKNLIFHIKNATWNSKRNKYEKCVDGSHFDTLDALIYLIRNIDYSKNPFPSDYGIPDSYFRSLKKKNQELTPIKERFKEMFHWRKKNK